MDDSLEYEAEKVPDYDKSRLWKLVRQKYVLTFKLCDGCQKDLFMDNNKFKEEDGNGVTVRFRLCRFCTGLNMQISDLHSKPRTKWVPKRNMSKSKWCWWNRRGGEADDQYRSWKGRNDDERAWKGRDDDEEPRALKRRDDEGEDYVWEKKRG